MFLMKQILKNIGIVILGIIIGMIVNIGLIILGGNPISEKDIKLFAAK